MSTPAARRMLSLAGMSWSFDTASDRLAELCLLKVSNDTIRSVSEQEGQVAAEWIAKSSVPTEVFQRASGDAEFYSDGVTVNTTEGWRDLRLNVMARREAGLPVTPGQWQQAGGCCPSPACGWPGRRWRRAISRGGGGGGWPGSWGWSMTST